MKTRYFQLCLFVGFLTTFGPLLHAEAVRRSPTVAWVFSIHDDSKAEPHGQVFLRVDDKPVLVEADARLHYQALGYSDYHAHNVPSCALVACTGWFAGGGEDLYVVRRGNRLKIYRRWVDEEAADQPYRLIRSIPFSSRRVRGRV